MENSRTPAHLETTIATKSLVLRIHIVGVVLEPDDERLADCLISDYVEFNSLPSNSILRYKQVVTQLWLVSILSWLSIGGIASKRMR